VDKPLIEDISVSEAPIVEISLASSFDWEEWEKDIDEQLLKEKRLKKKKEAQMRRQERKEAKAKAEVRQLKSNVVQN
jgi:hypothetical protein